MLLHYFVKVENQKKNNVTHNVAATQCYFQLSVSVWSLSYFLVLTRLLYKHARVKLFQSVKSYQK